MFGMRRRSSSPFSAALLTNKPVKGLPYCLGHARIAYRSVGRQGTSAGA